MASTVQKEENNWSPEAALTSSGGPKASVSRSEESLTRISTELTEEALFVARCHMYPVPLKKKTKDQGTQISKHAFFTSSGGTDTRSDRNRTRAKAHLLPPAHEKNIPQNVPLGRR
ncbi:putative protein T-ENOL [Octodon degus]|uniref:Uncharacterized protein n=1 Tax=Octodon degus TaxID=10160 RepID=A0A6P6DZ86_OCTDE|nr:putative protein T-ENOL [Octodon degus]XP_023565229.1 putative protein T-ENOL [Octodon degus]XP_023565232.1 putative protein T-ENOL [Octodon degus]